MTAIRHHAKKSAKCRLIRQFLIVATHLFSGPLNSQSIIQPTQYTSNTQQFTLSILPKQVDGLSGADYILYKDGQQLWSQQLNHTAVMADVSSSGEVITCAYTKGLEPALNKKNISDEGYMELKYFNASGQMIWSTSSKRKLSMRIHSPPSPYCEQVLIQEHTKQAFIWIYQNQQTQLKVINGSSGKPIENINFDSAQASELTSVKDMKFHSIDGTGLLLVEIVGRIHEKNEKGNGYYGYESDALFYLLDSKGRTRWQQHFMGSLDIRKTTDEKDQQQAYARRKAYLKRNDLLKIDAAKKRFAITNYNEQTMYWYQWTESFEIKPIHTEPLTFKTTPFETKVTNLTSPELLKRIDLTGYRSDNKPICSQNYDAIDVLSDGSLLLYEEKNHTLIKFTGFDEAPLTITVPVAWIKDEYIPHELMFVGGEDQIHINLGNSSYAVFDNSGQYIKTIAMETNCGEFCFVNFVAQKQSHKIWAQEGTNGVTLAQSNDEGYEPILTAIKDSNGRWFEYLYEIQSDEQGRLLMLGQTADAFNQLYVLDSNAQAIATLDLGHGYTTAATMTEKYIFVSESKLDEIAVLNHQGGVVQRFKTPNNQASYLLKAAQHKLYAVTADTILVYDISKWTK